MAARYEGPRGEGFRKSTMSVRKMDAIINGAAKRQGLAVTIPPRKRGRPRKRGSAKADLQDNVSSLKVYEGAGPLFLAFSGGWVLVGIRRKYTVGRTFTKGGFTVAGLQMLKGDILYGVFGVQGHIGVTRFTGGRDLGGGTSAELVWVFEKKQEMDQYVAQVSQTPDRNQSGDVEMENVGHEDFPMIKGRIAFELMDMDEVELTMELLGISFPLSELMEPNSNKITILAMLRWSDPGTFSALADSIDYSSTQGMNCL